MIEFAPIGGTARSTAGVIPSPAAIAWASELIEFDTISRNSNMALIDHVRGHLEHLGLPVAVTTNADGSKANLFATIPAADGTRSGGLILSGHSDVVPPDGQCWTSPPFSPTVRDGKLFGRGACDMKGFLGVAISLVPAFQAMRLNQPIHLALSYDEEVGCLGAPLMIADLVERDVKPAGCIVGEPTMMRPVVAHKAIRLFRCTVHGRAGHASRTHEGVNAIEHAAAIIGFLRTKAETLRDTLQMAAFDPPWSTISVGQIEGGTACNIIPDQCSFTFEYRALPGYAPDDLEADLRRHVDQIVLPEMRATAAEADVRIARIAAVPSLDRDHRPELAAMASALTGCPPGCVSYATEAGQFQAANIPTIVCGPGSIEQAHKGDEWVSLKQLAACEAFLLAMADPPLAPVATPDELR